MRSFNYLIIAATAAVAATVITTAPVRADVEYAWCGFLSISGGSQSCTFTTIDQCRAYVSGWGFCQPNPRASLAEMRKRNPRR
jgi:Protein of unknown function (DUF3551)